MDWTMKQLNLINLIIKCWEKSNLIAPAPSSWTSFRTSSQRLTSPIQALLIHFLTLSMYILSYLVHDQKLAKARNPRNLPDHLKHEEHCWWPGTSHPDQYDGAGRTWIHIRVQSGKEAISSNQMWWWRWAFGHGYGRLELEGFKIRVRGEPTSWIWLFPWLIII